MEQITSARFRARFFNESGKPTDAYGMVVQFKSTRSTQWLNLVSGDVNKKGVFDEIFSLPVRLPKDEKAIRMFREILEMGGLPELRLVTMNKKDVGAEYVVSASGKSNVSKEQLVYTFDDVRMLDENKWDQLPMVKSPSGNVVEVSFSSVLTNESADINLQMAALSQLSTLTASDATIDDGSQPQEADDQLDPAEWEAERIALEQTINENMQEIQSLSLQLDEKNTIINQKDQQIFSLNQTVEGLNAELQNLQDETEFEPKAISADKMYTNVLNEVNLAKQTATTSGFRLANVTLNLKAVAEQDESGIRFQLVDAVQAETINTSAVSDINIQLVDSEPIAASQESSGQGVPNMIGLTESACRKKLQLAGLKLLPVYQKASNKVLGQAFKQTPAAGESYVTGQGVTVVFAKELNA